MLQSDVRFNGIHMYVLGFDPDLFASLRFNMTRFGTNKSAPSSNNEIDHIIILLIRLGQNIYFPMTRLTLS